MLLPLPILDTSFRFINPPPFFNPSSSQDLLNSTSEHSSLSTSTMASDLEECPARKKVKTTTPKAKAEAKPKSPKTPKTPKSPKSAKPPKEKTPKDKTDSAPRPNKATKIPTCMEEMTDADKMIIRMKDAGSSNAEIAKAWNDLTGANVTGDSIKTRVRRIKDNLQVWPTGHVRTSILHCITKWLTFK